MMDMGPDIIAVKSSVQNGEFKKHPGVHVKF